MTRGQRIRAAWDRSRALYDAVLRRWRLARYSGRQAAELPSLVAVYAAHCRASRVHDFRLYLT